MSDRFEDAKGKAKEAAGDLMDDDDLKREGELDQAGASVKDKFGDAVDRVKDEIDGALDRNEDD